MREQYDDDPRFREYVDRYCKAREIDTSEALTHALIKSAADYYKGLRNETK